MTFFPEPESAPAGRNSAPGGARIVQVIDCQTAGNLLAKFNMPSVGIGAAVLDEHGRLWVQTSEHDGQVSRTWRWMRIYLPPLPSAES